MSEPPDRRSPSGTCAVVAEELTSLWARLQVLLASDPLAPDEFLEVITIQSNVAHIFVYLEGNQRHVDHASLVRWYGEFHENGDLDEKLLKRFRETRFLDPRTEETRRSYVSWLAERTQDTDAGFARATAALHAEAKQATAGLREDRLDLLRRLGANPGAASPEAVFHRMASEAESGDIRSKLARVWRKQRDRRTAPQVAAVDRIVELRRRQSGNRGHESALGQTLQKSSLTEAVARDFIEEYLVQAVDGCANLAEGIRGLTGCAERPMDHFGYYLRAQVDGANLPLFRLEPCLEYVFEIAGRVLGLTVARVQDRNPDVITVAVRRQESAMGEVRFDLLPARGSPGSENHPVAAHGTAPRDARQGPVGRVLCRFQPGDGDARLVTFESLHSVFHEFGHALNHLLLSKRVPSSSGMDYLPLERLEDLSMWWEKWVYHPDLAGVLGLTAAERTGLDLCRRVKMLEFRRSDVERSVIAALDFDVHGRSEGGIVESFQRLDEKFGVSRYCDFGDLPRYFSWPMFRLNPGMGFMYLWGSADSAQKFAPFMNRGLETLNSPDEFRELFRTCFEVDASSVRPDISSVPVLYDVKGVR